MNSITVKNASAFAKVAEIIKMYDDCGYIFIVAIDANGTRFELAQTVDFDIK